MARGIQVRRTRVSAVQATELESAFIESFSPCKPPQKGRRHVELSIFARFVCRVVAIDRFLEFVGGNAQLLSELGNRIGLNLNPSRFQ